MADAVLLIRHIVRRMLQAAGSLLVASLLIWALQLLTPGDPAARVLQARGIEHPEPLQIEAERSALGLGRPAPVRYVEWLWSVLHGDFGTSWVSDRRVGAEIWQRLPATVLLTGVALLIAVVAAVVLAVASAAFAGGAVDRAVRVLCIALAVMPGFLIGTLLIDLVVLRWGHGRVLSDGTWRTVGLPAGALSLILIDRWTRALRAGLLDALDAPYLLVAGARGAGALRRLVRHALPNALVPFLTLIGVELAVLLGGSPIIETVFTWPGVGRYAVEAITARDVPVVQAFTLLTVTLYITGSMLTDIVVAFLDPRTVPVTAARARSSGAVA